MGYGPISRAAVWVEQSPARALLFPTAFLLLFYVLPLVGIALVSVLPGGHLSASKYVEFTRDVTFLSTIWRTVRMSLLVSLICLLLGYPYAYLVTKVGAWFRRFMIAAVLVPFFTSILIRSYAWIAILGARGPVNKALRQLGLVEGPIQLVYNEIGALIGMSQIQLPVMILTIYGVMRRIEPDLGRAAESLGAHRITTFLKVFLPLSLPGVISGLGLVFTSTLGFYVTPAMLGGPSDFVVTQSIYVRLNSLNDISGAAAQATILLALVSVLLWSLRRFLGATSDAAALETGVTRANPPRPGFGGRFPEAILLRLGRGSDALLGLARVAVAADATLVVLVLTATMITVIPLGLSQDAYLRFPPSGYSTRWVETYLTDRQWLDSTYFSTWISVGGGAIATTLGSTAAYAMARWDGARKGLMEIFLISPMIMPQFVVALALYLIFIKLGLVGNAVTYVLAYAVFGFPYVFLIMYAAFQRFDFSLVQAGAVLGATPLGIWRRIVVPVLAPSFLSAAVFAFLTAFDDLVVGLFFSSSGRYTLPMRMWANVRAEVSPQIAAVAVVFLAVALVGVAALSLLRLATARELHVTAR